MLKQLKPFLGPGVGFLIGTGLQISSLQNNVASAFIFGLATAWLLFAFLDSAKIAARWPGLHEWLPFLELHQAPPPTQPAGPTETERLQQREIEVLKEQLRTKTDEVSRANARTSHLEAKLESTNSGGLTRLDIVRSRLHEQAKYGRDAATVHQMQSWMSATEVLVRGLLKIDTANKLHRGCPSGSSSRELSPKELASREKTMASLRVLEGTITEKDLI